MTLKWSPSFKTGDSEIDEQHKALFNFINDLIEASTPEKLTRALMILYGYTRGHFEYEEAVMRRIQVPKPVYDTHVAEHNALVTVLNDVSSSVADGSIDLKAVDLLVTKWCVEHIPVMDKQLAAYLNAYVVKTELF